MMSAGYNEANPIFVPLRVSSRARARLVCFHHAAGAASSFRLWPRAFPDNLDLLAIQLPGREQRAGEPFHTEMSVAADEAAQALETLCDLPLFVFGHSLGGTLAFEAARRVERAGFAHLAGLVVAASRPPHVAPRGRPLSTLPEDDLIAELASFEGTPQVIFQDRQLLRFFLPRIRADFALSESGVADAPLPLDVPILALAGTHDSVVPPLDVSAWRSCAGGAFEFDEFEGGHFFVKEERFGTGDRIAAYIDRRLASGP